MSGFYDMVGFYGMNENIYCQVWPSKFKSMGVVVMSSTTKKSVKTNGIINRIFLLVIFTNGNNSVYNVVDYVDFYKGVTVGFFPDDFTDGKTERFKSGSPYSNVTQSPANF